MGRKSWKNLFVVDTEAPEELDGHYGEIELSKVAAVAAEAVELEEVNTDTLISDIYAQNGLMEKERSIFKVEELINTLPKEMVTDVKKTSVMAILGSFGIQITEVLDDAEKRISVLNGVKEMILKESNAEIVEKEALIEECKKQIATYEAMIAEAKEEMKMSSESISAETARINKLVEFVGVA